MESLEKLQYDKIANEIQGNIGRINEILSSCEIGSNFVSNKSEEKIVEFLKKSEDLSLIKNVSSSEYYDSEKLSALFQMLDNSGGALGTKQAVRSRVGSVSSLSEFSKLN